MSLITAKEYCITTFPSTHAAMAAEKVLTLVKINFLLVPLPMGISASCGLGVKYIKKDYDEILAVLQKNQVSIQASYYCFKENGKLIVTMM